MKRHAFVRLRAFGLALPSRAMTANDNWRGPEFLSVTVDTWVHRYFGRRDTSIPLREVLRDNRLRDHYTITEAS
jgi:hypothetical protein